MKPTLTLDTSGNVLTWSREAEVLLGYTAAEALGQSIEFIIPPHLRGRHHAGFARYVQTGVSHLPEVTISPAVQKSGEIIKMQISVYPVHDEQKQIVAVQAMMRLLESA
jgi:PAS domain S-box-containing protein